MSRTHQVPFLVGISNVVVFAVIHVFQLILKIPVQYIPPQNPPGYDYQDFYYASLFLLRGRSPYEVSRFVTPPLPSVLNLALTPLQFESARNVFIFLTVLAVLLSYVISYFAFNDPRASDNIRLLGSGILLIAVSYPFYFLVGRSNIDGLVLFAMIAGLVLLPKRAEIGSLLLAVAILSKLYPLLLLAYLFFTRRWKPLLWTCGWMFVLAILTWSLWDDYFASSYHRLFFFRLDENGSLANTIMILIVFLKLLFTGTIDFDFSQTSTVLTAVLYATTLILMFYSDYKRVSDDTRRGALANALLYLPFMAAIPQLVYHYEFVILLPLVPVIGYLWSQGASPFGKLCLLLTGIGISLSQMQAVALFRLTGNMLAQYIPGLGLVLILFGVSFYKFLQLKQGLAHGRASDMLPRTPEILATQAALH